MMVRRRFRLVLLGVGLVSGWLVPPGVRGEDAPVADAITALVEQLGHPQYLKREAAMHELAGLDAALPALKKAATSPDLETRRRAQELVQHIERRLETARLLQPKYVQLSYKAVPLGDAVNEFAKTGFPLQLAGGQQGYGNRTITLETDKIPFWEAFDLFCKKAGLMERSLEPPGKHGAGNATSADHAQLQREVRVVLQQRRRLVVSGPGSDQQTQPCLLILGKAPALPTCQQSAIRIRALPPNLAPAGNSRSRDEVQLALEVTPDPRLVWGHFGDVRIEKAVDDQGQVLTQCLRVPKTQVDLDELEEILILNDGFNDVDLLGNAARQLPVRLFLEKKPAKMLRELTGTVSAQVRTPLEPLITVDQVLKAEGKTLTGPEGSSVKVLEASHQPDGECYLRVEVKGPSSSGNGGMFMVRGARLVRVNVNGRLVVDSTGRSAPTNLQVLDATGQALQASRSETRMIRQENEVVQEYRLTYPARSGHGEPAKLVFSGQRTVAIQVPFRLENVPLP